MSGRDKKYPAHLPRSFCYLPWIQFGTTVGGFPRLCANTPALRDKEGIRLQISQQLSIDEVWNGEPMKEVRRQMMTGDLPDICSRCGEMEKAGVESKRLKMIHLQPDWAGDSRELLEATREDGSLSLKPRSYNLRLGNTCNLKCGMCRPDFSSKWKGDFAKLLESKAKIPQSALQHLEFPGGGESGDHRWYEDSRVFEVLKNNLPNTQQYYFSGGEPMMTNLHRDLIQLCVESGHSHHIHLMYDTNGLFIDEEWLRLWENFASVDIHLSIDGIGKKYEYIRYPARWVDFTKVAALLSQWNAPNATVRILVTQQLLNVLDGVEILRWYIDTIGTRAGVRYQIVWNLVEWPECLTSQLASEAIGEKAKQKLLEFAGELRNQWKNRQEDFVKSPQAFLLKDLDRRLSYALNRSGGNGESLKDFIQYLNALDQVRGTQWVEVFPELAEMIRAEL